MGVGSFEKIIMSSEIRMAIGTLPTYWKLATIRCSIYALIVGASAFDAGVEGYGSFTDMSPMQLWKLALNIIVAMAGVWVAFLDQSMSKVGGQTVTDSVTLTHTEPKISPASDPAKMEKTNEPAAGGSSATLPPA